MFLVFVSELHHYLNLPRFTRDPVQAGALLFMLFVATVSLFFVVIGFGLRDGSPWARTSIFIIFPVLIFIDLAILNNVRFVQPEQAWFAFGCTIVWYIVFLRYLNTDKALVFFKKKRESLDEKDRDFF